MGKTLDAKLDEVLINKVQGPELVRLRGVFKEWDVLYARESCKWGVQDVISEVGRAVRVEMYLNLT